MTSNTKPTVQGQVASAPEYLYASALEKYRGSLVDDYFFQYRVQTSQTLPGEDNKVDFLVKSRGIWYAKEVDGEIAHKTMSQKEHDRQRDLFVNEALKKLGVEPVERMDAEIKLKDFASADEFVQEQFR